MLNSKRGLFQDSKDKKLLNSPRISPEKILDKYRMYLNCPRLSTMTSQIFSNRKRSKLQQKKLTLVWLSKTSYSFLKSYRKPNRTTTHRSKITMLSKNSSNYLTDKANARFQWVKSLTTCSRKNTINRTRLKNQRITTELRFKATTSNILRA